MRATLLVLMGCCLLAVPPAALGAAAPKAAKAPAKAAPAKAKAEPAKVEKPEDIVLGPEAAKRIALVEPALPKGMQKSSIKKLTDAIEADFKAQGYEIVPPPQVKAMHLKRKLKAPACADDPGCLAKAGKIAGAAYVANLFIAPAAGKSFNLKLMIIDSADGALVVNRASVVLKATDPIFAETIKKQVPKAAAALGTRIAEKEALAAALAQAKKSEEPKPAEATPVAVEQPKPEEPKPAETKPAVAETKPAETTPAVETAPEQPKPAEPAVAATGLANPDATAPGEPVASVSSTQSGSGPAPWILLGTGAVAAGVGVGVFGTMARSAAEDFKNGNDALNARSRAKTNALICDVATGVGAALAVTGVIWLIYSAASSPSEPAPAVQAGVAVTPTGASVALSGSF
ncbi:MAG TPA: hypothetical protein VGK67_24215 [Myxococcales bacterium]|jgi:hypothetical protein